MAANQRKTSAPRKSAKTKTTQKKNSHSNLNTKEYHDEIALIITLVISLLLILSSFHLSGKAGEVINGVTFGLFGFLAYLLPYLLFFGTAFYISNRGNFSATKKLLCGISISIVLMGLLQMITNHSADLKLVEYYKASSSGKNGGGIVGGVLCKAFTPLFGVVGTYIILVAIILILIVFITEKFLVSALTKKGSNTVAQMREKGKTYIEERGMKGEAPKQKAKTFTFKKEDSGNVDKVLLKEEAKIKKANKKAAKEVKDDMEEVAPKKVFDFPIQKQKEEGEPVFEKELSSKFGQSKNYDIKQLADQIMAEDSDSVLEFFQDEPSLEAVDEPLPELQLWEDETEDGLPDIQIRATEVPEETGGFEQAEVPRLAEIIKPMEAPKPAETSKSPEIHSVGEIQKAFKGGAAPVYKFPPVNLLSLPKVSGKATSDAELKEIAMKLQSTLESFGVRVTITNISCGPSVTRYELQPEQGVKVSKITSLSDDIKLNLAAADIRIEAPIPGKAAVGIEVPNKTNTAVMFRELIENPDFTNHPSDIAFAVGKDIGGQTVVTDIGKMPHLLIAGATGSGKSVCINTLIMSILYKANPADVKLIMVDPKVVELSVYNGIPHLLIPVVTDPKKASAALNWAVMEMTERYNKFAELGVRDIKGYNEKIKTVEEYQDDRYQKMPQIVIIVDELADLMMVAPGEVEDAICRLAQMARAAGLHLIIATQRPSVNVITGLIKANVPSRIAFSVSSAIDSRTIIDGSGAEKLLGKGDMLFFPSGYPKPVRIQGAFVSDQEVSAVVEFLAAQNNASQYSEEIEDKIATAGSAADTSGTGSSNDRDDYFVEAGKFIIDKDKASIGMLQRVYKIGFNRAARIMDQLCEAGVVGQEEGTKPRKVLMSLEEFEQYVEEYV